MITEVTRFFLWRTSWVAFRPISFGWSLMRCGFFSSVCHWELCCLFCFQTFPSLCFLRENEFVSTVRQIFWIHQCFEANFVCSMIQDAFSFAQYSTNAGKESLFYHSQIPGQLSRGWMALLEHCVFTASGSLCCQSLIENRLTAPNTTIGSQILQFSSLAL